MKKMNKAFWILLAVGLVSLAALGVLYPSLPEQVPTHWNVYGEIDGWGDRWMVLLLGALAPVMTLLMWVVPRIDPRKQNYEKSMGPYLVITVFITLLMSGCGWCSALTALGWKIPVGRIIPLLIGIMFVALGNLMPRIRSTYMFGIRTPWTLASDTVWKKTHRLGGICFCISGLTFCLAAVVPGVWTFAISIGFILLSTLFTFIYSWYIFQKEQRK